ncbi:membrane protein DedA with SNARE-associated domain [Terracoccus luteus]|uniref:Membrane protein DedA with SNARE-associated domain n=1 Tax=Terracoccus luteus TaxID=53356 RepID=A0A495XVD2_9MICO|nr:DedA family protein [Terracoccus luteus]RKT76766.1 membrane protein DedA with SNARE-associated domain [Terracoccus luteus]
MIGDLVSKILDAPAALVLVVVGLVVFAEDALFVGFVLPGETVAILGGVAANRGHVPLAAVLAVVIAAAVIGDSVGFEVGRRLGPRLLDSKPLRKHHARIDAAQDFLKRRGGWAVLLGRWVAFFRAVMPALAGSSPMTYRTFLLFNALGGILWGSVVVTAGYLAGASYQKVEAVFGRDAAIVAGVVVVLGVVVWRVRTHRAEKAGSAGRAGATHTADRGNEGTDRDEQPTPAR